MLDISFFIDSIVSLLIGLGFFLFFLYFFLKLEKNSFVNKIIKNKFGYFFTYFLFGLLIGIVSLFFDLIQASININNQNINTYVFITDIVVIVLCGFYLNPIIFVGSTITYTLSTILFHINNWNELSLSLYLLIFYSILCLIVTFLYLLKEKRFVFLFVLSIFSSILTLISAILFVPKSVIAFAYVLPWIGNLTIIIYFLFSIPIVNFIGKTKQLSHLTKFDKNNFILFGHAHESILDYIRTNKVKHGIVLLFDFCKQNSKTSPINNVLIKMIKSKINLSSKEYKPIWFLTPSNYYGLYIGVSEKKFNLSSLKSVYAGNYLLTRNLDDPFLKYDNIFKTLPENVRYKNELYSLNYRFVAMIYGIHSSNLDKIIFTLETLMRQYEFINQMNRIHVFNPKEFSLIENDANLYKKLLTKIKVNELTPYWTQHTNLLNLNQKFYYLNLSWPNKLLFNKYALLKNINNLEICNTLIRMMAIQGIKMFVNNIYFQNKKSFLIIDYPIKLFTEEKFNIKNFIAKIKQQNLSFNNLIINLFSFENIKNNDPIFLNSILKDNIRHLYSLGIRFVISSELINLKNIKNLCLNFCLFESKNISQSKLLKLNNLLMANNVGILVESNS